MNDQLRYEGSDPEVQQHIDNVSSAVKKSILPSNMVLYRGAGSNVLGHLLGFDGSGMNSAQMRRHLLQNKDSLTKKVIRDQGFTSTSINKGIASGFAKNNDGHLIQINAPEGSHGAYLAPSPTVNANRRSCWTRDSSLRSPTSSTTRKPAC